MCGPSVKKNPSCSAKRDSAEKTWVLHSKPMLNITLKRRYSHLWDRESADGEFKVSVFLYCTISSAIFFLLLIPASSISTGLTGVRTTIPHLLQFLVLKKKFLFYYKNSQFVTLSIYSVFEELSL